jgi:hypothetical protein
MYLGTISKPQKRYATRWHEYLGDQSYCVGVVDTAYQRFQCESCGRVSDCLDIDGTLPSEPFFCECQRLIAIASPLNVVGSNR